MTQIERVEGVPPEKTVDVRDQPRAYVPHNPHQPYFTPGDLVAGLVAAAVIWGPLAAGGLGLF